jgi:Flp pilus assembly protein CpaB
LKRSNRLIFLIGIILAIVAAIGVFYLAGGSGGGGTGGPGSSPTPPPVTVVTAKNEITLGTVIEADMLNTSKLPQNEVPFDVISSASAIAGLPARQTIPAGVPITLSMFQSLGSTSNKEVLRALDPGFRAMAVQVDQVTGVGTIIQPGDRVDVIISFEDSDGKFPVIYEGAPTVSQGPPRTTVRTFENFDDKLNNTSVKVLIQDSKVLGTLLPPPPAQETSGATPAPTTATGEVALNGQQQIVILQLTPQQVELARFAQLDGNLSLVLRAVRDRDVPPIATSGITLFELVRTWGVLPGQMTLQAPPAPKVAP